MIYRLHRFTQDGKVFEPKTPPAVFMNSNCTSSFVAGLLQLRYMYAMPVERIIHYFEDQGFNLKKPTAGFLLGRAAETLENLYKAIRKAVLSDDYIASDETYFKILVPEKNSKGKGVKKGYFWVIVGQKSGLCMSSTVTARVPETSSTMSFTTITATCTAMRQASTERYRAMISPI